MGSLPVIVSEDGGGIQRDDMQEEEIKIDLVVGETIQSDNIDLNSDRLPPKLKEEKSL